MAKNSLRIWKKDLLLYIKMVSSVCGGNQVRSTKTSVSCLQSSMVVGVSWSGAAWVALGSYSSLREPWMPTFSVTYWSRAWSPSFGDWAAGQYSYMITTTALLKQLRVKVMDWPSMSPDLNPTEHLWGILQWKVEERKLSNIFIWPDKVSFMSWALLCLQPLPGKPLYFWHSKSIS